MQSLRTLRLVDATDSEPRDIPSVVAELVERSAASNALLMQGDVEGHRALVTYADDFTLMSPFGGTPTHRAHLTDSRWEDIGRFFRNGTFEQEVVQTYATADMVVLVLIERQNVEVGGLPAQDWALRVTLVYRKDGGDWRLAHRHADPLSARITVPRAAELAGAET